MAEGPTFSHWAELRARRPTAEDALSTLPITARGTETAVQMGIDQAGHLHLLIPVEAGPAGQPPSDLNGLKVRHRHLSTGQFLDLIASPSHERVFTPVCNEIVDAVLEEQRDPWLAAGATIRAWQSAWKPSRSEMEKSVQIGLFGELKVLEALMLPCLGPIAVDQWSGPHSERHDFVSGDLDIEVKTTRKMRHEHEISRLDQLRVDSGKQLLLVSVLVEQSIGGQQTLSTLIDAILGQLRGDAAAMDSFMTKMVHMGWSDEMRRSGELLKFSVRGAPVYLVDEDFPRLPDDFTAPSGVIAVKYTVDLANMPALSIQEATAMIRAANGF